MIKTIKQRIASVALAGIIALGCVGVATTTALISSATDTTTAYAAGWQKGKGGWCYNTGANCATDWKKINGCWYYFNSDGYMQTGWQKCGGCWYYFNNNGVMQTGWNHVGNCWYYLNSSGVMQTGWQKINGMWYYFDKNGTMVTGWNKVDGTWYLHAPSGAMLTGWQTIGGKWYYLNTSGAMKTSSWIDGYYYVKADGSMATNTWIYGYYVGPDGRWIPGYSEATNNGADNNQTVYWVANGKRYHSTLDCPALGRSTNIQSGSITQAGNRTACKDCY